MQMITVKIYFVPEGSTKTCKAAKRRPDGSVIVDASDAYLSDGWLFTVRARPNDDAGHVVGQRISIDRQNLHKMYFLSSPLLDLKAFSRRKHLCVVGVEKWPSSALLPSFQTGDHPLTITSELKSAEVELCHVASRCPLKILNVWAFRDAEQSKRHLTNFNPRYSNCRTSSEGRSGDT
jgi:hypothetical protein